MELVYTDAAFERQGVIRDFALDMAYGDDENDFQLTMPLPKSVRHGADREAVTSDLPGVGSITIEAANGSQLAGIEVQGKSEQRTYSGKNLFDHEAYPFTDDLYVNYTSGNASTASTTGAYKATQKMRLNVPSGSKISINKSSTKGSIVGMAFFNSSSKFISGAKMDNYQGIQVPDGAVIYRFTVPFDTDPSTVQVEVGEVSTDYEPYVGGMPAPNPDYPQPVEVVRGRNLLDIDNVGYTAKKYVRTNDGALVTSTKETTYASGYMDVRLLAGNAVTLTSGVPVSGTTTGAAFFDAGKAYLSGFPYPKSETAQNVKIDIPADAVYMRFTFNVDDASDIKVQIERGTTATPYVPYGALELVTRGKNLFDVGKYPFTDAKWIDSNGNFTTSSSGKWAATAAYIPFSQYVGETVCFSHIGTDSDACFYDDAKQVILYKNFRTSTGFSTVVPEGTAYVRFDCWVDNKSNVQIEIGEVETPYEPYTETRTTIDTQGNPLASLPDGTRDELTVDASGHVQLVRNVGYATFTGAASETWSWSSAGTAYTTLADAKYTGGNTNPNGVIAVADRFTFNGSYTAGNAMEGGFTVGSASSKTSFAFRSSANFTSAATFRTWLASNPTTVYYPLKEPQTIDLGTIELPHTLDGYTRITLDATMAAPFTVRYVEFPATHSYVVEVVPELEIGALVYEHGTDIGGIIDTKGFDNTGDVPVMTYSGRTWHGILGASITRPDSGQPHLVLTGDINAAIATLIDRSGLGGVFSAAPAAGVAISYTVPRYVSMWDAIRGLCKQYGMRPLIERGNDKTVLGAAEKQDYSNGAVSDLSMGLQFERFHRPVNHLVLLGQGELAGRTVIDIYADQDGNVSTTQTLFGADEVTDVYENTSESDAGKLLNDGIEKLRDMQKFASVGMSLPSNEGFQIGDTVTAYSVETGLVAAAEVVKKVVTVGDNGFAITDYELGEPAVKAYR